MDSYMTPRANGVGSGSNAASASAPGANASNSTRAASIPNASNPLSQADDIMTDGFGGESAQPLFLAEASTLLTLKLSKLEQEDPDMTPVLKKSLKHLERFDAFRGAEAAVDVRYMLEHAEPPLHPFELAQLASLCPKDAEEAKAIIPSLKTTVEDDAKLNDILKALDNFVR